MKDIMLAVTCAAIALAGPAFAQTLDEWVVEDWGVRLTIDPAYWRHYPTGDDAQLILQIGPHTEAGAVCELDYNAHSAPLGASRVQLNAITRAMHESPAMQETLSELPGTRPELAEADGVTMSDIVGPFGSLETVQRRFFLYHDREVRMFTLGCSADKNDSAATAAMRAVVSSIRFSEPTL